MTTSDLKKSDQTSSEDDIISLIAPSGLKINPNCLEIGRKFARTIFVFRYPRSVVGGWLSSLINLDEELSISLFVIPTSTESVLKDLTKKTAKIQSQISIEAESGKVRNPILEIALKDVEKLRDQLQEGTEKLFKIGIYITFLADSVKQLDAVENKIRALLETQMVYSKSASYQQEEGFITNLPIKNDQLNIYNSFNTSPLSSAFPFVSFNLSDDKGVLYGINRHNNSLILFDRFSLENANFTIFGVAGGGKSYFVKLEILRSLVQDIDVIVIDPEKEYRHLAEAVGSTFIDISLNSGNHINPFDLPPIGPEESASDLLRENIVSLTGLLKIMLSGVTPEEDSILDKAIMETYASRDITPQSDFSQAKIPLMQDLYVILSNMTGAESLSTRLEKYITGSYAGFFNQPTNVDLSKKLIVFGIRDMADELRPMAMYMVIHYIWKLIRSQKKKRIMVIDEAWWMMQHKEAAAFLFSIAKRCRKYFLGLTTITQDVPDFMRSEYGQPILTNSALQLLLKQSPSTIEVVQKTFNLTNQEKNLLLECGVGEGLFFASLKHVAIQIIGSYSEDEIITTNPAQLLAIEEAKKELAQNSEL